MTLTYNPFITLKLFGEFCLLSELDFSNISNCTIAEVLPVSPQVKIRHMLIVISPTTLILSGFSWIFIWIHSIYIEDSNKRRNNRTIVIYLCPVRDIYQINNRLLNYFDSRIIHNVSEQAIDYDRTCALILISKRQFSINMVALTLDYKFFSTSTVLVNAAFLCHKQMFFNWNIIFR